ncbi:MAG: glycosyltransferase family 9 protein [Lentisphaerae bacterium]|nr:glycosyltransferase family 9 protein [Lentisphaerota bacterium]
MNDAPQGPCSRILIVKLSSLGDIVHALPAVHNLRMATGATVDWAVQSEYVDLVRCVEGIRRVIPTERHAFMRHAPGLWRDLRLERYDLVVDLQGLLKSAIVARMARGGMRIGPSFQREGTRLFYHRIAGPRDVARHAVEQNLDVIPALGLARCTPAFSLRFPAAPLAAGALHVGLLPVSRWPSKNWPAAHFATLAKLLLADARVTVYLMGGRGDAAVCAHIAAGLDPARVQMLAGRQSLIELGSALQAMDLLVSNDSGPVHMAAAVGTPTLVLFGPTDATRTGPYGAGHRVLRAPPPCFPCYERQCQRHGGACLERLAPEAVNQIAREMLAERKKV